MPQSLVRMLIHVVFQPKNRSDLIVPDIENDLFGYMHGIVENNGAKLIVANGTANHVHLLVTPTKNTGAEEPCGTADIKRASWVRKHTFYAACAISN